MLAAAGILIRMESILTCSVVHFGSSTVILSLDHDMICMFMSLFLKLFRIVMMTMDSNVLYSGVHTTYNSSTINCMYSSSLQEFGCVAVSHKRS